MTEKWARVFCALLLMLLICFPGLFRTDASERLIAQWLSVGRPSYAGELEIVLINAQADGSARLQTWLRGRAAAFEKQYFGIYPSVTVMSAQTLNSRIKEGDMPDVVLCSSEMEDATLRTFAPLNAPAFLTAPQLYQGRLTPICQNGFVLAIHEDALYAHGVLPPGLYGPDSAWTEEALEKWPEAFGLEEDALLAPAAALLTPVLDESTQQALCMAQTYTAKELASGKVGVSVGTTKLLYALYADKSSPSYLAIPLPGLAGEGQYAAVCSTGEEERMAAASAFVSFLLNKASQRAVSMLWAVPVRADVTCDTAELNSLWLTFSEPQPTLVLDAAQRRQWAELLARKAAPEDLRQWLETACKVGFRRVK